MKKYIAAGLSLLQILFLAVPVMAEKEIYDQAVAMDYIRDCMERREEDINLIIDYDDTRWFRHEMEDCVRDTVCSLVSDYRVSFKEGEKSYYLDVDLHVNEYRPCVRLADAAKSGRTDSLSEDERRCLEIAQQVVHEIWLYSQSALGMEKEIHDYICNHVSYQSYNETREERVLSCIGALLDGRANCQGYSDTFYLMCSLAGIDAGLSGGWGEEYADQHIWNYVMYGDEGYFVDVTWDDLDADPGHPEITYAYYNVGFDRLDSHDAWSLAAPKEILFLTEDGSANNVDYWGGVCYSLAEMTEYLERRGELGFRDGYVRLAGDYSVNEIGDAISARMNQRYGYCEWTYHIENVAGDTFVSLIWNSFS